MFSGGQVRRRPRGRYTVKYMVRLQARPPTSWEMASAVNTPVVPIQIGRTTVSGALMMALRSREKKTACLERPRLTNTSLPRHLEGPGDKQAEVNAQGGDAGSHHLRLTVEDPDQKPGEQHGGGPEDSGVTNRHATLKRMELRTRLYRPAP